MVSKRLMGAAALLLLAAGAAGAAGLTVKEQLGKDIFFDTNLSINGNQSCADCHAPEAGWTGPTSEVNAHGAVYEGSIAGRFGNRKPPSSAYATTAPILNYIRQGGGMFVGGNFWDGRATGEKLGNPAADQAQGPFLNPLEQALPDSACVVHRVCTATYGTAMDAVWPGSCAIAWPADVDTACATEGAFVNLDAPNRAKSNLAYDYIALAIAAYEGSAESNAFTSKYDAFLAGKAFLTPEERRGLALFNGKGKCARCHVNTGKKPLFTDYTYDNLGVPRNVENPFYQSTFNPLGAAWIDLGLGGFLESRIDYSRFAKANLGKHKVPTLRNVDKKAAPDVVKAFGHNGYFKSLKEIVHFYNTRDVLPTCAPGSPGEKVTCWPLPELALTMNTAELGNLKLSDAEEDALVAFMKTLTDGYQP
ncbi:MULTISPECIES: cytochrome-c peroxidase [Geobacter]|uniref:cytochrome-c peroxidase n=1 Tax=Geobacter TaxID=28231 RepID=UPI00257471EB|nr:cytochrome c peroxidase [Geobacter sulfurreducens]BEH10481.1 cytochrome c peroxidase [Geobacter sulfurreducens subsp. ethanolicus]BET57931.1 cytochrome c peroxidase [Geobacter sp. 60473]